MPAPRYAVLGNPVAHSRSPAIHQMFAAQEGTAIEYERLLAEPGCFAQAAAAFFAAGGMGANVTVPFKTDACAWAGSLSERARAAGAANTLIKQANGRIHADNTDGLGLVADISRNFQVAFGRFMLNRSGAQGG